MGMGHVPQDPLRAEGAGADVQGRQRRGTAPRRPVDLARQARGRWGEDQAARWYVRNGYQVLARNWRCDTGELDLVVTTGNTIVFVEVKARANDRYGSPALAVDHRKQRRLRLLAVRWLSEMNAASSAPIGRHELRFDVVAITGTTIEVFESAF